MSKLCPSCNLEPIDDNETVCPTCLDLQIDTSNIIEESWVYEADQ